jgi:hypothetical protein
MDSDNNVPVVNGLQQEQMLKLITRGFYKELINYGIDKKTLSWFHLIYLIIYCRT